MLDAAAALAGGAKPPYERLGVGSTSNPFYFNYVGIDGKGGGGGIVSNGACPTGGNGDINATALALAWPADKRPQGCGNPKPEYRTALDQIKPVSGSDPCGNGCSCSVFVAVAMVYSGADEGFRTHMNTSSQCSYMNSHKDLYEEIPNQGNTSNMQPGDILILCGHHVMFYAKREDGVEGIASASLCGRTADFNPGVGQAWSDKRGTYKIYRFKGNTSK